MRRSTATLAFTIFLVLASSSSGVTQRVLRPFRTDTPPIIDGKLNDPLWQKAPYVTDFKTWTPDYGIDMPEKTRAFFAYDRENLYFAFQCFDREPDKIKTSITNRDNIRSDDWVCINLDSFNDHQTLYSFYINPAGIQEDSKSASGVFSEDKSIDLVWYSGGQIDNQGYTIEIRIPFKSIRFTHKNPVEMGVIFERRISRRSESGTYPPLLPERGFDFLTQTVPLIYYDVKHYTLFELLPAVTYSNRQSMVEGKLVSERKEEEFSLTTKYGITSELILDGTYNPDFSQVEADAGQVDINLRYELFYPEKRPFFLEGSENFTFSGSSGSDPLSALVHTRTIVDPYVGVKLAGKIGKKGMIASILALDELPNGHGSSDKREYTQVAILRYKRALYEDSYIGGVYTGKEHKESYNRVFGIDGQSRINASSTLGYYIVGSHDQDMDETSKKEGYALGYDYSYATRNLSIGLGVQEISRDFITQTGYITRTGIFLARASLGPKFYPSSPLIRRCDLTVSTSYIRDRIDQLNETGNSLSVKFHFLKNSSITTSISYATEVYRAQTFDISNVQVNGKSQLTKRFYLNVTYQYGERIYYAADPYQGRGNQVSATVIYQPSDKIKADMLLTYSDFYRDSDSVKIYDYTIGRCKLTYQMNRYLFFRAIVEYNDYKREMLTDFLASFTYIPGTVVHIGYGNLHEKIAWQNGRYVESDRFLETKRGFFFKTSYLWRL